MHAAGTPRYMAPEQWAGETWPASDWYSVGVMLYEALTGSGLPDAPTWQRTEKTRPLARPDFPPCVPADLADLCGIAQREAGGPSLRSGDRSLPDGARSLQWPKTGVGGAQANSASWRRLAGRSLGASL